MNEIIVHYSFGYCIFGLDIWFLKFLSLFISFKMVFKCILTVQSISINRGWEASEAYIQTQSETSERETTPKYPAIENRYPHVKY